MFFSVPLYRSGRENLSSAMAVEAVVATVRRTGRGRRPGAAVTKRVSGVRSEAARRARGASIACGQTDGQTRLRLSGRDTGRLVQGQTTPRTLSERGRHAGEWQYSCRELEAGSAEERRSNAKHINTHAYGQLKGVCIVHFSAHFWVLIGTTCCSQPSTLIPLEGGGGLNPKVFWQYHINFWYTFSHILYAHFVKFLQGQATRYGQVNPFPKTFKPVSQLQYLKDRSAILSDW